MNSSLIIPLIFWNNSKPSFRISSVCVTPSLKKLVTGSFSGQLCLWDLDIKRRKLTPKNILIGHKDSVTCMVCTNEYVISSCESKQILRWNLDDGYCSKMNETSHIHRKMELFRTNCDECVIACGDYSEIFIIHSFTLQVIFILHSNTNQDWISSFQVKSEEKGNFVFGITSSGCAKFWTFGDEFTNESLFELKSEVTPMTEIVDMKYNVNQSKLLIVSVDCFSIYDSEVSTCLCKIEASNGEKLLGGNFTENDLIVWTKCGKFYFYDVSEKETLISVIMDEYTHTSVFEPACHFAQVDDERYLIKGDFWGKISIWKINEQEKQCQPLLSSSLAEKWVDDTFFNFYIKHSEITCCIYVLQMDKFFIGCHNGCIISIPARQSVMAFYFRSSTDTSGDVFIGHSGRINCLLYPHEKYSHFNKSHLVSGSSDFSVCLWDVYKVELIYKFCVQSGEILSLIVPPENCSSQVKYSVCSVSLDNSVAVLNLKDQRCVILTSRHIYPVIGIHWKPLDDFVVVECFDGTVYVWQLETGHLDRVIDGVMGQEIVYACNECSTTQQYNFYIHDRHFNEKIISKVFTADENITNSFVFSRFFIGNSESHVFLIDVEHLCAEIDCNFNCSISSEIYLLTQAISTELQRKSHLEKLTKDIDIVQEFELSKNNNINMHSEENEASQCKKKFLTDCTQKKIQFLLSAIHFWGLNSSLDEILLSKLGFLQPVKFISFGILSHPGVFSLFLPNQLFSWQKIPSFVTSFGVSIAALSKIMQYNGYECDKMEQQRIFWEELGSFYEKICTNGEIISKIKIEILCKLWQIKCLPIQKVAHNFLYKHIKALDPKDNGDLLNFWYRYLPHFKILDKTLPEKVDFENKELKTIALVLFGAIGSDLKFKASDLLSQENFTYQTCASFVYLLSLPNSQKNHFSNLQVIAIDFIGRGYIVWEQFLKIEKIIPILLKLCTNSSKTRLQFNNAELSVDVMMTVDMYLTAQNALKSIAIARTAEFISCLTHEVTNIKLGRGDSSVMEYSKAEILSVLSYLLEKTPYFMLLYLNDVISLIVYCIDFSHLKQENLSNLFPVIQKFRQVHHSVTSQRIAVGLATGSLVLHDLRTGKAVEVPAHRDSISALKFSEDGKSLVSYSCYENRLSYWQILTGMFGLGQFHVKCTKSCPTYQIHDEEIRNHLEIASLTWTNKKSVLLSLCDGTENIFKF